MLDYHLHLWPHSVQAVDASLEQVAAYCERAQAAGVTEIALTEHLHRFHQADKLWSGFWAEDDPDPALCASFGRYWRWHATADLDQYVEVVLAAKQAGLPVRLGLEVDHYASRMDEVARLLDGYPFDVLLGSVHWLGAWGFDNLTDAAFAAEWDKRTVESIWDGYTDALEELAASGAVDVLAHPDLVKIGRRSPAVPDEWWDRMAEAAASCGLAAEVSSAGLLKGLGELYPAPGLLSRFAARDVPVTTASDAHRLDTVAAHGDELRAGLSAAGYDELAAYRGRRRHAVPVAPAPASAPAASEIDP